MGGNLEVPFRPADNRVTPNLHCRLPPEVPGIGLAKPGVTPPDGALSAGAFTSRPGGAAFNVGVWVSGTLPLVRPLICWPGGSLTHSGLPHPCSPLVWLSPCVMYVYG